MEAFLTVLFWMYIVGMVLRLGVIGCSDYPRTQEYSLGFDVAMFLFHIPFFIWIIYLKFYGV